MSATAALECPFECFHNSTCAAGKADFSDHSDNGGAPLSFHVEVSREGKHCACPPGFTGLRCGREFHTCNDGQHKCYNGGKCIEGLDDVYGNHQLFCDCNDAVDKHGVRHVGKYCEIPATQTCDDVGKQFCVNGGYCKDNYQDSPNHPCRCGDKHDGPHCEFDKGAVPECTRTCQNGGKCKLGIPGDTVVGQDDLLFNFWKNHSDYQFCECEPGTFGTDCEIKGDKCGDHHCFHGGTCIKRRNAGGGVSNFCDCTTGERDGKAFAGQYCQYSSSHFCDKGDTPNGQQFCVNGGSCKSDGSHLGCDCPDGFHGPICEFKDSPSPPPTFEECKLQCANGGQCRKGAKDMSFLDNFGPELEQFNISHSKDFEHCVCPPGWTGLTCDHKIEICGANEFACFHGSTCTKQGEDEDHSCNCESGFSAFEKLAGKFCEHKSTTICTRNGRIGLSHQNFAFCVNDGTCKEIVEDDGSTHAGCNCPNMFYGPHCEFLKSALTDQDKASIDNTPVVDQAPAFAPAPTFNKDAYKDGLDPSDVFAITCGFIVSVGAVLFLYVHSKSRKTMDTGANKSDEVSHQSFDVSSQSPAMMDMNPAVAQELTTVEIL